LDESIPELGMPIKQSQTCIEKGCLKSKVKVTRWRLLLPSVYANKVYNSRTKWHRKSAHRL